MSRAAQAVKDGCQAPHRDRHAIGRTGRPHETGAAAYETPPYEVARRGSGLRDVVRRDGDWVSPSAAAWPGVGVAARDGSDWDSEMALYDEGIAPIQPVSAERRPAPGPTPADVTTRVEADARAADANPPRPAPSGASGAVASVPLGDAHITFEKDQDSGRMVVRLKDASGKVIRQIPPEEMLRLAKAIDRYLGLLVDRQS